MSLSSKILIKPLVTERLTALSERLNRYGFIVVRSANKIEIKRAVEDFYNVEVLEVNTMNYMGKRKGRFAKGGYIRGRKPAFKKAIVTVKNGDTIDFFSNI